MSDLNVSPSVCLCMFVHACECVRMCDECVNTRVFSLSACVA